MSSIPSSQQKHIDFVNSLIKIGHIDRQDSNKSRKDSTSMQADNMEDDMSDRFIETISDLGIVNKDLLFLGTIINLQSFTKLLRQLRSLENVKLSPVGETTKWKPSPEDQANEQNGKIQPSISINCRDHTKDVVAFNYISNNLDSDDLQVLIVQALNALRPSGYLVMREHLYGSSAGDDLTNKFYFRTPSKTCSMMNAITDSNRQDGFQLISGFSPDPVGGKQEMTWLYQKVGIDTPAKKLQEFLDAQQYTKKGILKYEKIFGDRYISTGGERTTKEFCQLLQIQRGESVLDVGCGIGGSGFLMAKEYGAYVHGLDLSSNMISIAIDRRRTGGYHGVDFEISNILTREFSANSFDLAYSRDVILHITDKKKLFQDIFKWLKPGGKLFVTDYCCGVKEHSSDFRDYVKQRGYILLTVPDYGKLLQEVGFVNVHAEDRTKQFISILHTELQKFEPQQAEFVEEFSQTDYDEIVDGWNAKVKRCGAGDQAWGMFLAEKPEF